MTTKNLIPRASGEGGIGITDVTWGYGYYDTGNFNKGLFVSGHNITQVIAETVTQGGLGGEWTKAVNGLDIYYDGGKVGIGTTNPGAKLVVQGDKALSDPETTGLGHSVHILNTNTDINTGSSLFLGSNSNTGAVLLVGFKFLHETTLKMVIKNIKPLILKKLRLTVILIIFYWLALFLLIGKVPFHFDWPIILCTTVCIFCCNF